MALFRPAAADRSRDSAERSFCCGQARCKARPNNATPEIDVTHGSPRRGADSILTSSATVWNVLRMTRHNTFSAKHWLGFVLFVAGVTLSGVAVAQTTDPGAVALTPVEMKWT